MKALFKTIYRLDVFIAILLAIVVGCKEPVKKGPSPDESQKAEINYDSLHSILAGNNLQNGGANIFLEIKNPDALFNSDDPSFIQAGNANLEYLAIQSTGKPGDDRGTSQDITAKDLKSIVYTGKTVVWILRPKSRQGYKFDFQEVDFGEGKNPDNGNEPCNAFTIKRDKPKTEGVDNGAIVTQVEDDPGLVNCQQNYTLIFSVESDSGEKRTFTLDPWVLVK